MFTYADIPDRIRTKRFIPFGRHLWRLYQEMGTEYYEKSIEKMSTELVYDIFRTRLDRTINTAKAVIEGSIKHPDKVLSYLLFPPVLPIRGDLSQSSIKLVYGESTDMTFLICNDTNEEIAFVLNGHCEDGIPVDWWLVGPEDELLDRRHLKLGYKLRELPKKTKGFFNAGERSIDILKDVRNERTPQWAGSSYIICMVWISGLLNLLSEPSNYEQFASIWDGIMAKKLGLPEEYFGYVPWPQLLRTFMVAGRKKWTLSLTGITTALLMYWMPVEAGAVDWIIEHVPELYNLGILRGRQEGIPYPSQSLGVELPDYKKKSTYEKEQFAFKYPPGDWITPDDLDLSQEDVLKGVYLNIDHDTRPSEKITPAHIISIGYGLDTEYLQEIELI